jgi:threonine dehydrogenase-like Zn-dependent dehydrogenase
MNFALNPTDHFGRDSDAYIMAIKFPAVLGADVSGVIAAVGPDVDRLRVGDRVTAIVHSTFISGSNPNYGGFQEYTLAKAAGVALLPDAVSFENGAVCSIAAYTTLSAYRILGVPFDTAYVASDRQAILIWGAASSVGTFAVQVARRFGFTVYATASTINHDYVRSLGAHVVFDYSDPDIVSQIVATAARDGVTLRLAQCIIVHGLEHTIAVLREVRRMMSNEARHKRAAIASVMMLPEAFHIDDSDGIDVSFVSHTLEEPLKTERIFAAMQWLEHNLQTGAVVPSPPVRRIEGGLEATDGALNTLRDGVNCCKLVLSPKDSVRKAG